MELLNNIQTYCHCCSNQINLSDNDILVLSVCKINPGETHPSLIGSALHPEEQKIYNSYKHDKRKHSYLLGRVASKTAIQKYTQVQPKDVNIINGLLRQPIVKGINNVDVSISHADNLGFAAAFNDTLLLGIDIEKHQDESASYLQEYLMDKEKMYTSMSELTLLWSAKEALSKCLKIGLTSSFELYQIKQWNLIHDLYQIEFRYFPQFKCSSFFVDSYVFSVVTLADFTPDLSGFKKKIAENNLKSW